jgi:RND family efflux transporter MFP subunit
MKISNNPKRIIVTLLLLCVISSACATNRQADEPTPTPIPTPVIPTKPTYQVALGEVVRKLEFTGRIVPVIQEELYFKIDGRVAKVMVSKGDQVKAGQLLAELEIGTSPVDVRRAEINLERAKLNKEMTILQTNKYSLGYNITLKLKDYDIELAQLALDEINARVNTAQIKAPFDGTIMSISLEPDQVVKAYKSEVVLADINQVEVRADLTQTVLVNLQEGLAVQIFPASGPGQGLNGTLSGLPYPYGKLTMPTEKVKADNATHVTLIDDLTKVNLGLGDIVRVVAVLEKKDKVLWLPPQAIRKFEGRQYVLVQETSGQRRVDVRIGIVSDDRVEITDGLSEGQVIVSP